MKKDITSRDYWQTLANLGLAVGRENLPKIEDVAEHVLSYKQKILPLIKTEDYTQSEYSGNYYDKRRKVIFLDELYEVVKELNQW